MAIASSVAAGIGSAGHCYLHRRAQIVADDRSPWITPSCL
jgi:hypothetical protein